MRSFLRHLAESTAVGRMLWSWRREQMARDYFERAGVALLERRLRRFQVPVITAGPFRGLEYLDVASGSVWGAKICGTYERELHPTVADILAAKPDVVVDLGCAEGYYAVGFAANLSHARIIAADLDPLARGRCRRLARKNGVDDRITFSGRVDHAKLESLLQPCHNPVLWCDIEGAEYDLLDPERVPSLRRTWIVFEDHGALLGRTVQDIVSRFAEPERLDRIPAEARSSVDLAGGLFPVNWSEEDRLKLIHEHRPWPQVWISLRPNGWAASETDPKGPRSI